MESPLEAPLAFNNFLSFGFLITVLDGFVTWVAVLTAAISYWRIRLVGFRSDSTSTTSPNGLNCEERIREESPVSTPLERSSSSSCFASSTIENERLVKGKYTLYYKEDIHHEDEDYSNVDATVRESLNDGFGSINVVYGCESRDWNGMLVKRMEDPSWYHYQDLRVLDGSIVRLWDGVKIKGGFTWDRVVVGARI